MSRQQGDEPAAVQARLAGVVACTVGAIFLIMGYDVERAAAAVVLGLLLLVIGLGKLLPRWLSQGYVFLVVLAFAGYLTRAAQYTNRERERERLRVDAANRLAERVGSERAAMQSGRRDALPSLAEACSGRLSSVAPQALLGAFDDELAGFGAEGRFQSTPIPARVASYGWLERFVWGYALETPSRWDEYVESFRSMPAVDAARYLLVALPPTGGDTHVRVLDLSSGARVCEGLVGVRGMDWHWAARGAVFLEVCSAGGAELCRLAAGVTGQR